MKVHLASSKWLYLSVSAALSLCCLPNPIARSAWPVCQLANDAAPRPPLASVMLATGHLKVYTTYDKVTSTWLYHLFFFHFYFLIICHCSPCDNLLLLTFEDQKRVYAELDQPTISDESVEIVSSKMLQTSVPLTITLLNWLGRLHLLIFG